MNNIEDPPGGKAGLAMPGKSCALLEVESWIIFRQEIWELRFAARTNLVVYLNATRTVVI
jgi:hypothetical protein